MKHLKVYWPTKTVNIPVGRHHVIIAGFGTLDKQSRFRRFKPYAGRTRLDYCCDKRIAERRQDEQPASPPQAR